VLNPVRGDMFIERQRAAAYLICGVFGSINMSLLRGLNLDFFKGRKAPKTNPVFILYLRTPRIASGRQDRLRGDKVELDDNDEFGRVRPSWLKLTRVD